MHEGSVYLSTQGVYKFYFLNTDELPGDVFAVYNVNDILVISTKED